MAVTKSTITLSSPWTRDDMITQMESAFATLGWHGGPLSGLGLSLSSVTGGGTVSTAVNSDYYSVETTTTGSGSGCTVSVSRNSSGVVDTVKLEKPGSGYTNGDSMTVSASDIGGSSNGATNITFTLNVDGGNSPNSYGTTSTFFDKDLGGTYPWGVVRHVIDASKTYGHTYRAFKAYSDTSMLAYEGNSFFPRNSDNTANYKWGYRNSFRGTTPDVGRAYQTGGSQDSTLELDDTQSTDPTFLLVGGRSADGEDHQISVGVTGFDSNLNIYRSGLDPKFAVFSWHQPSRSSTDITGNMGTTMFFHNFNSDLFDYDYVHLSGHTKIIAEPADGDDESKLRFRTYTQSGGEQYRAALSGYFWSNNYYSSFWADTDYRSNLAADQTGSPDGTNVVFLYAKNEDNTAYGDGYSNTYKQYEPVSDDVGSVRTMPTGVFFNAVLKGIPLSTRIAPVPYYLPDDFGLIQFQIDSNYQNINQGDTITISGSEVWTVITGSYYHDSNRDMTSGVLFCARTT